MPLPPGRRERGRRGAPAPHDHQAELRRLESPLGLALGGGGARGLCHIGVMRVLEELDIRPDLVAGTSMGGLVGAFIAAGYTAEEMTRVAGEVRWTSMIDWRISGRLLSGKRIAAWLSDHLPATFEELELPLVLATTDIVEGRLHYLSQGDLITALRATTAYPGVIPPVPAGDALLVDGGILNQIPVDGALALGARRVVAVDATTLTPMSAPDIEADRYQRRHALGTLREAFRAIDVMQAQLTAARLGFYRPDVLIDPPIAGVDIGDFHRSTIAIDSGEQAARDKTDQLQALAATRRRGVGPSVGAGSGAVDEGTTTEEVTQVADDARDPDGRST
ncbi:patatin-like phospholipase family protein [Ornithinimicrobium sp. W1665]|uniref:patatin-like phospholipase family protein n=1 Tax=Ornithinimicrobium sp. W1665 TaxID=3416666 RepID=UPI003CEB9C22